MKRMQRSRTHGALGKSTRAAQSTRESSCYSTSAQPPYPSCGPTPCLHPSLAPLTAPRQPPTSPIEPPSRPLHHGGGSSDPRYRLFYFAAGARTYLALTHSLVLHLAHNIFSSSSSLCLVSAPIQCDLACSRPLRNSTSSRTTLLVAISRRAQYQWYHIAAHRSTHRNHALSTHVDIFRVQPLDYRTWSDHRHIFCGRPRV